MQEGERGFKAIGEEDQRFWPRGRSSSSGVVVGGGKVKVRAMPASEAVLMKGRVRRSMPWDREVRTSCGVDGSERQRIGRWESGAGTEAVVDESEIVRPDR